MDRRRLAGLAIAALLAGLFPAAVAAAGPTAVNDHVSVPVDAAATGLDVLGNDVGSGLTIESAGPAGHGTVAVAVDGLTLTYQPDASYHATDTFDYTITDGDTTDVGTVTVDVNSPPVAVDDPGSACGDTSATGGGFVLPEDMHSAGPPAGYLTLFGNCALLHNDSDPDGDPLTWQIVTQPANGDLVKIDEEFLAYKADPDYGTPSGDLPGNTWHLDTFTYRAFDGFAFSAPATMSFWVVAINDAPTFDPGAAQVSVGEDSGAYSAPWATNISAGPGETGQAVHFEVDTDLNGVPNLFSVPPAISANGTLTFTPAPDQVGIVHVTARAKDDGGVSRMGFQASDLDAPDDTSDDVTFDIVVMPDAVTAVDDVAAFDEDPPSTPVLIPVTDNDTVPTGATITAVTQGTLGTVSIAPGSLGLLYTPHADANGTDTFTYTLNDHAGATDTATVVVTIAPINDVPVAGDDDVNVSRNAAATDVPVLLNDTDADGGDTLTISAKTDGAKGTVAITGGGTGLTYQPDTDATGADSFTYTVTDGHSPGVTATVSVIIADGVLPVAGDDARTLLEDAGATVISVLGNDSDGDGDSLSITGVTNGAKGVVTHTSTTVTYSPNHNANGADTFTYTIYDGHGGSATGHVAITITPVNDVPNAVNDSGISVPESAGARALAVLGNDTDDGPTALKIIKVTQGAHGSVAITGGGTGLTYNPNQLYYGGDQFTYTVTDGTLTDSATVLLTITKDTTRPVATAPVESFYGQTLGSSTMKARIAWSGTDTNGTGIARYQLQVSTNGGSYATVSLASATSTSVNRTLTDGRSYRFRVRATDKQGNVGAYVYGPTFKPARVQNTSSSVHYTGTWVTTSNGSALGGSHRYATSTGARASFSTTTRDIAWVTTKTSTSGSAQVWIDGSLAATVNLHSSSTSYRQLVFARHFSTLASHTIELRPAGGGRLYLDAFVVYH
jgi:hypothetical protein